MIFVDSKKLEHSDELFSEEFRRLEFKYIIFLLSYIKETS